MASIVYTYNGGVYINITNKCPCRCLFCIRANGDGLGSADSLWHTNEPSEKEIIDALKEFDFSPFDEVVFCGYGEPFNEFDKLLAACKFVKENLNLKIRINTNGLGDLINGFPTAEKIAPFIDSISISLNAPTPELYTRVTRPKFDGETAFRAMIDFAKRCKNLVPETTLTVVDVIHKEDIELSQKLCDKIGIPLRVRQYD
ncbi:MAG: TIGR04100 family radical SAM protein [Clostridia bacterium]|nr:TIGR04100 family radical SAM protein [Clostridia bacterium]